MTRGFTFLLVIDLVTFNVYGGTPFIGVIGVNETVVYSATPVTTGGIPVATPRIGLKILNLKVAIFGLTSPLVSETLKVYVS